MKFFTPTGKLKNFVFFLQLEMFDVCTTGDKAHIDTIFKFLPHKRQHGCMGAAIFSLHTLASPSGTNVNYNEQQLPGKKLSCSFYLYRFRKYVT
jgi:hypothetical protein